MECGDGSEISSRVHCGREDGVMGSLEARRAAEGNWTSFWRPSSSTYFLVAPHGGIRPAERRRSRLALTLAETRGDFQRRYGTSVGAVDRQVAGPLTLDGEPGNESQWRL